MELLLGSASSKRFNRAYTSERQLNSEERDYRDIAEAMEALKGIQGTELIGEVLANLTNAKKEINTAVTKYRECMDRCASQKGRVSSEDIDSLYESYIGVMVANFKKVKLISTAGPYYGNVVKAARKMRRNIKILLTYSKIKKGLSDIDYQLSYFSRLLPIYKDVIHMNVDRYKAYLRDMESSEVAYNIKLLR